MALKSSTFGRSKSRSFAAATIAAATGCSEACSTAAMSRSTSSVTSKRSTTRGRPSVKVPVLSQTRWVTFSRCCSASAPRKRMPSWAPRPIPTMIDIGVARPNAHGQAMISTATAFTSAKTSFGSGPSQYHRAKVVSAITATTGTNHAATRSTIACTGARLRCASATSCTMRDSMVSAPIFSATMIRLPVPLIVPAVRAASTCFSTGRDSPVSIDSSTLEPPSTTFPSTGTRAPGRTRSRLPTCTSSSGTSDSWPLSSIRTATCGARSSSVSSAAEVRDLALISSICPNNTSTMITAAASKYTGGPFMPRSASGNQSGFSSATTLKIHAAPTPSMISVNMFHRPVPSDRTPRTRKGQPHHATTGVASKNCVQRLHGASAQ